MILHFLVLLCGWLGVPVTVLAGYLVSTPKYRMYGFATFIVSESLLSGVQIQDRAWNQVTLFVTLMVMNANGIHNELKARKAALQGAPQ